ncbi:MAG: hypothetical protein QXN17_08620 [Nitrososphaerota archaeon]
MSCEESWRLVQAVFQTPNKASLFAFLTLEKQSILLDKAQISF